MKIRIAVLSAIAAVTLAIGANSFDAGTAEAGWNPKPAPAQPVAPVEPIDPPAALMGSTWS